MTHRLLANFSDAAAAQLAVSRILELGGRDRDICASYEGTHPAPTALSTASKVGLGTAAAGLSLLARSKMNLQSLSSRGSNPLSAIAASAAVWLAGRLLTRPELPLDPPETYEDGKARLAVHCPSGSLTRPQLRAIIQAHGGQFAAGVEAEQSW